MRCWSGAVVVLGVHAGLLLVQIQAQGMTQPVASRAPARQGVGLLRDGDVAQRIAAAAPDAHDLVAYVDCGASSVETIGGPVVRQLRGQPHVWPGEDRVLPLRSVAFDPEEVVYEMSGLEPGRRYVLGFTWWDFDGNGRRQSVRFGAGRPQSWTTVLPATEAVSYLENRSTYSLIHLPVPAELASAGRLTISFHREGPTNAVVNEVWLLQQASSSPADGSAARRRVLIVTGDDYPGHHWRLTAPELAGILRSDPRLEVTVTESAMILASPLLAHYDALLMHYKNWEPRADPGPEARSGLERYVRSGRGLSFVHFACGAFQGWSDYVKIAGRVWDPSMRPHDPYGEFLVRVCDRDHAVTAGLRDFRATDELYTCLAGDTPVHVIAEATSKVDQRPYPMAFVHENAGGRVFFSPLGHDVRALRSPGTRELLRRGTAWAAGLPLAGTNTAPGR